MKINLGLENRIDGPSGALLEIEDPVVVESQSNHRILARMKKREAELQPNIRQLSVASKKEFHAVEANQWMQSHLKDPLSGHFIQRNNYFNHEEFYYIEVSQKSLDELRACLQEYLGSDFTGLQAFQSAAFVLERKSKMNEPFVKGEAHKDYPVILTGIAEEQQSRRLEGDEIVLRKEWIATFSIPALKGFYGWTGDLSIRFAFQEKRVPLNIGFL